MTLSARAALVQVALVGVMVGLLGAFGWRYATRRIQVLDNPPPVMPGDKGFMFTFDYLQYVSGPRWWPGLLLLPATGCVVGVAAGAVCWFALRSNARPWAGWLLLAIPAVAVGVCVAAATLLLTHLDRPAVLIRAVMDSSQNAASDAEPITNAPWNHELAPTNWWFPVIGVLSALLLTLLLHSAHRITGSQDGFLRRTQ